MANGDGGEIGRQSEIAKVNLRAYAVMIAVLLGVSIRVNLEVTASMASIARAVGSVHVSAVAPAPASGREPAPAALPALPLGGR